NQRSTGALSDLEKVTKQARAMVTVYGLNEEIGNLTYYDSSGQNEYGFTKPYSEKTAQKIDEEIYKLIEEQYKRAVDLLSHHKDKLKELADRILEKEVIFKGDLEKIFGKRPFERDQLLALQEAAEKVEREKEATKAKKELELEKNKDEPASEK